MCENGLLDKSLCFSSVETQSWVFFVCWPILDPIISDASLKKRPQNEICDAENRNGALQTD